MSKQLVFFDNWLNRNKSKDNKREIKQWTNVPTLLNILSHRYSEDEYSLDYNRSLQLFTNEMWLTIFSFISFDLVQFKRLYRTSKQFYFLLHDPNSYYLKFINFTELNLCLIYFSYKDIPQAYQFIVTILLNNLASLKVDTVERFILNYFSFSKQTIRLFGQVGANCKEFFWLSQTYNIETANNTHPMQHFTKLERLVMVDTHQYCYHNNSNKYKIEFYNTDKFEIENLKNLMKIFEEHESIKRIYKNAIIWRFIKTYDNTIISSVGGHYDIKPGIKKDAYIYLIENKLLTHDNNYYTNNDFLEHVFAYKLLAMKESPIIYCEQEKITINDLVEISKLYLSTYGLDGRRANSKGVTLAGTIEEIEKYTLSERYKTFSNIKEKKIVKEPPAAGENSKWSGQFEGYFRKKKKRKGKKQKQLVDNSKVVKQEKTFSLSDFWFALLMLIVAAIVLTLVFYFKYKI
ncbi:hypothetical protein ABK040_012159 [Willaertia magna]